MTTVAITMYLLHGPALFCGPAVAEVNVPWVALPYRDYGDTWQCGDTIAIRADGEIRLFLALDAGPFGAYCVMQPDGACLPIATDVPEPWAWFNGLSTTGQVWNVTTKKRALAERAGM